MLILFIVPGEPNLNLFELPLEEHQAMLEADDIDEETAKLLASGVLEMTIVLALVTGRADETEGADARVH